VQLFYRQRFQLRRGCNEYDKSDLELFWIFSFTRRDGWLSRNKQVRNFEGDIVLDHQRICFLPINVKAIKKNMIMENIIIYQFFLLFDKRSQRSSRGMSKVSLSLEMLYLATDAERTPTAK